jgi:hypothetical protein
MKKPSKTPKTIKLQTAVAPASRRVRAFVRRAFLTKERANALHGKARELITKALQCGLKPGDAIEIEITAPDGSKKTELFSVKDNFIGQVAFKKAYLSRFELVTVPRTRRIDNPLLQQMADSVESLVQKPEAAQ